MELGVTFSSFSALWGVRQQWAPCPLLKDWSGLGAGKSKEKPPHRDIPSSKISTGLCLMVDLLPSFCLQKGHYFLTVFVKARLLLQSLEKSTFKCARQQWPSLNSSSPWSCGTRGAGWGSRLAPAFRGFAKQQRFVSNPQEPIEACQLRGSTKNLSRRDLTFSFVLISIVFSPLRRLFEVSGADI